MIIEIKIYCLVGQFLKNIHDLDGSYLLKIFDEDMKNYTLIHSCMIEFPDIFDI